MTTMHTWVSFDQRVKRALPGEKIVYHIGNLVLDREGKGDFFTVHLTATAAWRAMEAGKVDLVQRISGDKTEYIAVKRAEPHKKTEWTGCYDPKRKSYNKSVKEVA